MRFTQNIKKTEKVNLDLKDKKILYWLSQNARTPYTSLAKKVKLSKDAIKYRIKRLEEKGIIQGYLTAVDIVKLGYNTYHIFLQINRLNKEIRNKLIETLKSYPFVKVIIEFSGKYNYEVGIAAKNTQELDKIITKIINDVAEYLQEHQILIISKYYKGEVFPKNLLDINEITKTKKENSNKKIKIDKTDLKILDLLSENATQPLYKIGESVKLSPDAVNYRIKKLLKENIILKFIPIINYSALGYTIYAILLNINNLNEKKENTLKSFLKLNKNILWAVKTIGKYNTLMYICVENTNDLHQTLIELKELFSSDIKDYETLIAYEEYRYSYLPKICIK